MMAAAARTSGTRSPLASTLYRGSTVSAISRAVATARADASFDRRTIARCAEYAVVFSTAGRASAGFATLRFATTGFAATDTRDRDGFEFLVAALALVALTA